MQVKCFERFISFSLLELPPHRILLYHIQSYVRLLRTKVEDGDHNDNELIQVLAKIRSGGIGGRAGNGKLAESEFGMKG